MLKMRFWAALALGLSVASAAIAGSDNPTGVTGTTNKVTCSPSYGYVICTLPANVQIDTSLAIGGATIGANALAVTGSGTLSSGLTAANLNVTGSAIPANGVYLNSANALALSTASTLRFVLSNGGIQSANSAGVRILVGGANATTPTIIANQNDLTSGLGGATSVPAVIVGNATIQNWDSAKSTLTVPLVPKGYTVTALPVGMPQGARAFVTDAVACTFQGALTGGGSTYCPVSYDGSAWLGG